MIPSSERANAPRRHKRAHESALKAKAAPPAVEPSPEGRMRLVTERASRVRLVQDKLVTNRSATDAAARDEALDTHPVARRATKGDAHVSPTKKAPELPEWLQAIKPRSALTDALDAP